MSGICNNFEDALELGEMRFWKKTGAWIPLQPRGLDSLKHITSLGGWRDFCLISSRFSRTFIVNGLSV